MTEITEGPGAALRRARMEREIALHEVSEVLNLPLETIEAIEDDDYDALPSAVFAKGYVRAYAKLLELDADALVAAYPNHGDERLEEDAVARDQLGDLIKSYPQWILGGAGIVLALLLVLVVIWALPEDAEQPGQPPDAAQQAPGASDEPVAAVPSAQAVPAPAAVETTAPVVTGAVVEEADVGGPRPEVDAIAPSDLQDDSGRRITPGGDDRLRFQFTAECWVEVKSSAGTNLYSDLSRAGETLELVGQAPFRILLGYAPGVSLSFNGEPVALGPHTRNNVASLVLGQ